MVHSSPSASALRGRVLASLCACLPLLLLVLSPTPAVGEQLVFSDEFSELDNSVWEHELTLGGGGNWEFQYYTNNRSNSYVRDGVLYLKPTLTSEFVGDDSLMNGVEINLWGSTPADQCTGNAFFGCQRSAGGGGNVLNPIQSARIRTAQSFSTKFGRVEIRAKLPRGDWIWPAMWMLPRFNQYGGWPASGEIDIMESRGNSAGYPFGGVDTIASTLHWGPDFSRNQYLKTHGEFKARGGDFHDEWHTFGLKWDANGLYTYVDEDANRVMEVSFAEQSFWQRGGFDESRLKNPWSGRSNAAPFDQKFFLIFNVAVGGTATYFPDGAGGKPWANTDPHAVNAFWAAKNQWMSTWNEEDVAMQIDWVRVYA